MAKYVYETNAYFGIHYNTEDTVTALGTSAEKKKWKGLITDSCHAAVKRCNMYASTNSDVPDGATLGFIFIDEMTIAGDTVDSPSDTSINLEPAEMQRLERVYKAEVDELYSLYEEIEKKFKKDGISTEDLYFGWRVINCTWDESESGEDDESDESNGESDDESDD